MDVKELCPAITLAPADQSWFEDTFNVAGLVRVNFMKFLDKFFENSLTFMIHCDVGYVQRSHDLAIDDSLAFADIELHVCGIKPGIPLRRREKLMYKVNHISISI